MQIDNEFTVSVPIEQAWAVLTDLAAIAPCLPGAQLTGVDGGVYTGRVKVKVGPVTSEYAGTARFAEKDDAAHRALIDARGRDARGSGIASAAIAAQLRPDGERTAVSVSTDLKISGRIAQFGSGMIREVSAKLLGQFVESLESRLAAMAPGNAAAEGAVVYAGSGAASPGATAAGPGPAEDATALAAGDPAPGGAVPFAAAAAGDEPPPLNLMSVAGGSIYKRVVPLIALAVIVVGLVLYFAVR